MKIKNKNLPKGIKEFIKYQKSIGGKIKLKFKYIVDCSIKNKKIIECKYIEDDTELEWFSNEGILYIFVDSLNHSYYTKDEGLIKI